MKAAPTIDRELAAAKGICAPRASRLLESGVADHIG